jgi:hypothetical protein
MLSRRNVLMGAAAGGAGLALGTAGASAFTIEPMPVDVKSAYALACGDSNSHSQLIADTKLLLDGAIARGKAPAHAEEIVICPICGCKIVVTADAQP